ncbi:MAG: response regulator [Planctomycetaceae bacterium]
MVRGRYADAAEAFELAAEVADGVVAKAELQGKLAELAIKRGDMEQAVSDYSSALRLLGTRVPRSEFVLFLGFVWEAIIQGLHTALPVLFVHRRRTSPGEVDRLKMRLFSGLSHGCWYCRSKLAVYWSHLRGMNLAERFPPSLELAQIYADHAPAMTIIPVPAFRRGIRYAEKSLAIRKTYGDLWGQGQSLHYYGVVLYAASRYQECIERCRESIRILDRLGDYWQVHIARYQIAAAYYRLGDLDAALAEARLNHKSGLELGDEQASGIILDVWAWATDGHVPAEILRREQSRERRDAQGAAQVLCAQGVCQLAEGDAAGAVDSIEQAIQICERAGVRNDYTRPLLTWRATALRCWAEQIRDLTPHTRRLLVDRAMAAVRTALAATRFYRNERPHALREFGLILAMRGRVERGLDFIDRSLLLARRLDARYEQSLSQAARARLWKELGISDALDHLREAEAMIGELQPAGAGGTAPSAGEDLPSLSLVDRFGTVLDAGRKIASALSKNVIFDETLVAASHLLRGENCMLVHVNQSDDSLQFALVDTGTGRPVNESIITECIRGGRTMTSGTSPGDPRHGAAGDTCERSVLCAPISLRDRVVACLYVSHDNVSGLFGPTEERLAAFIATIAGAALENAEGFAELQRLNDTLERRVADRTRVVEARARELAVSNEKLAQTAERLRQAQDEIIASKKQVEAASEAKSRFLAAMSHEVRTPMNGIIGMAELALRTALSEQQRGYIKTINESAAVLLSLLNDVLDFSKIEAGKMELEQVPLSLREIVGGCVRMLAGRAAEKKIELICRIAPDVPQSVVGDPSRLRQVLINLLGNAIKFTPQGEVLVHVWREDDVRTPHTEADSHHIHILVQDTGIGIAPERQQAIFEAFNQANTSVNRQFGGTGLGLSISTELVALMRGRLWVESEPGAGSRFHAVVPLGDDTGAVPQNPVFPQELRVSALLLSENLSASAAYREMLTECGLVVTAVTNVEDAQWAWLEAQRGTQPFSLLLADARADAEIDPQWLIELRNTIGDAHCPLVLLTPVDQMESAEVFRECGADHVLMKPVLPADVRNCMNNLLKLNTEGFGAAPENGEDPVRQNPSSSPGASGLSLRVLVADDSAVNREVAAGLLEFLGHQVETAKNGREAVEAVRQHNFDVVLMDIEMPEMNGYEATRAIREAEALSGRHLPIIAMSAHAADELAHSGREAGMDHYVSKPIEPAQVKYVLEHLEEFVADAVS